MELSRKPTALDAPSSYRGSGEPCAVTWSSLLSLRSAIPRNPPRLFIINFDFSRTDLF